MKYVANSLIAFGVLVSLIAFNLDVAVNDSGVSNLNLMAQRQNVLILGCVMFIAGIILWAGGNKKTLGTDFASVEPKEIRRASVGARMLWEKYDISAKLILLSTVTSLFAICLPWEMNGSSYGGEFFEVSRSYVGSSKFLAIIFLWTYPVVSIFSPKRRNITVLSINASAALCWIGWAFSRFNAWKVAIEGTGILVKMGPGMALASCAVLFLLAGVAMAWYEWREE